MFQNEKIIVVEHVLASPVNDEGKPIRKDRSTKIPVTVPWDYPDPNMSAKEQSVDLQRRQAERGTLGNLQQGAGASANDVKVAELALKKADAEAKKAEAEAKKAEAEARKAEAKK